MYGDTSVELCDGPFSAMETRFLQPIGTGTVARKHLREMQLLSLTLCRNLAGYYSDNNDTTVIGNVYSKTVGSL